MGIFKAGVQHGDFKGSIATDRDDLQEPTTWLRNRGLISKDEYLLGIRMSRPLDDLVDVSFFVIELDGSAGCLDLALQSRAPIELREIHHDMKLIDFLSLFKNFCITLSPNGALEGKPYVIK